MFVIPETYKFKTMKLEIIKTKETDGDWLKVFCDDNCKACLKLGTTSRTDEETMNRALEIYDFLKENKGTAQVIKSETI